MQANKQQVASSGSKALLASRGFRKAPDELARLIRIANLVPAHESLPTLDVTGDDEKRRQFRHWAVNSNRAELKKWLKSRLKGLPDEFKKYVLGGKNGHGHAIWFFGALQRYDFVRESRKKLREIARAVREAETTKRLPIHLYLGTQAWYFIDESWILRKTSNDEFDAALFDSRENINTRYIRECPVCGLIFFAGREKQPGCSPNHSQILRQRKSRANTPPAKTEMVQAAINEFESHYNKPFEPTPDNIRELSEIWTADATPKQIKRVIEYLKRAVTKAG